MIGTMDIIINIWNIGKLTFKNSVRHKAIRFILGFTVIILGCNIIVADCFSWEPAKVAVDFGFSVTSFCGLLLIFFLAVKLLSDDLERRTIYLILSRPVSRRQYIIGKFSGFSSILLVAFILLGIGCIASVKYIIWKYPGFIPPHFSWYKFVLALSLGWISLEIVLSVCFFWLSCSSNSLTALLLSIGSYFIGENIDLLVKLSEKSKQGGLLIKYLVKSLSWIFPNLYLFDLQTVAAYGLPVRTSEVLCVVGYGISYMAVILFFTIFLFNRKEFA